MSRFALLGALLLASGCRHLETHYAALAGPGSPPQGPAAATELHLDRLPTRTFRELGLVQAIGYGSDGDEVHVLAALRDEGQRRGCEAVVRVHVDRGQGACHAIGVCVQWATPDVP